MQEGAAELQPELQKLPPRSRAVAWRMLARKPPTMPKALVGGSNRSELALAHLMLTQQPVSQKPPAPHWEASVQMSRPPQAAFWSQ